MSKYSGTLLPQSNEPQEIQKGMLDLLAKINEIAEPGASTAATVKSVSANYTFTPTDGILDLFVTTAASTITVTLDGTAGRVVRVWKADAGVGEVKVVGRTLGATTQTIDGFAAVYVGLRYQHADIYQDGTTCFVIGQYFQPVPGEPSLGMPHPKTTRTAGWLYQNAAPTVYTWYLVDFSGETSVGAKAVHASVITDTAVGRVFWADNNGAPFNDATTVVHAAGGTRAGGRVLLELNSLRKGYIACEFATQDIYVSHVSLESL